jgi:phosphoglycolate phosphatase-like HAD superfamily hydrolase
VSRGRVLLFDIDGTLLRAGGAGRRALQQALEAHLGPAVKPEEPWLSGMKLDGMTDRLIVREALLAVGHAFDEALCDRILDTYARRLEEEIRGPGFQVLPGVAALLSALAERKATFGLCTGNIAAGARIKLAAGGLDRYFGFGDVDINGFADDGEARERIVEAALGRAARRLGRPLAPREALVIGDTPRDIAAAKAAGCPVLAVATGRFTVEALAAEGADHALPSLGTDAARDLLLGDLHWDGLTLGKGRA